MWPDERRDQTLRSLRGRTRKGKERNNLGRVGRIIRLTCPNEERYETRAPHQSFGWFWFHFHVLKFTVEDDGMCLENFHVQVFVKKVIIAVALFNGIPNISRRLRFL